MAVGLEEYQGFHVGDKVTVQARQNYDRSKWLAKFVNEKTYEIIQIGGPSSPDDRIVIGINGQVTAAVKASEITNITNPATPLPEEEPVVVEEAPPEHVVDTPTGPPVQELVETPAPLDASKLADQLLNFGSKILDTIKKGLNNLATANNTVYLHDTREKASQGSDDDYWYQINQMLAAKAASQMSTADIAKLDRSDPGFVQNNAKFPPVKSFDESVGRYRYNYYMDYEGDGLMRGLHVPTDNAIRRALNIDIMSRGDLVQKYATSYNKFKLLNANDVLAHSYAHVFFVRPDCNILTGPSTLHKQLKTYSDFFYALKQAPFILRELTQPEANYNHELMLYLSNKAGSFEVSDEYITTGTYGESLTGFKIPYGKSVVESQGAGKFSITYHDDRDLHIYHLHRLWTNYISNVYRGKLYPKEKYILNKCLDYATCVYYILTAEDGETVIFWSKYWGVFPIEAPSSQFSFNLDNAGGVSNPELKLEYQFAWKEDFNPLSLIEFNEHTRILPKTYVPPFQGVKAGTGYTWAGPPFIETMKNPNGLDLPYTFKLRFRKG